MREIKKIVIHCTDSCDSLDIGAKEINDWHRARGWLSPSGVSIGYHYVIRRNGVVETGRPVAEVGAHVAGHNKDSIGICWVGRKKPSEKQLERLKALVKLLMSDFKIDICNVFGHYELDKNKTCPNLNMDLFRAETLFVEGWRDK